MTNMRRLLKTPTLHLRDGGMFDGIKRAIGMGPAETVTEKYARQDAELMAKTVKQAPPAPPAPTTPIVPDYTGNPALARRMKDAGLRDGGDLRTGQGGHVPGSGSGDKIPAKYEPGEFVASNDMLDAAPGLREQLHGLRNEVLAAKGVTPEQADAKALGYDTGSTRSQDEHTQGVRSGGQERLEGRGRYPDVGGVGAQARGALGDRVHHLQQVSLRAADGFTLDERPWNGSQDARLFAQQPGPGNPNVGASGSAQSQAFQQARAPITSAPTAPATPIQPTAPAAKPTLRASLAEQPRMLGKASVTGGRIAGGALRVLGPAAAGADAVSHFGDYKINDPEVDSSASGTWKALRSGDFGGAGRSLSKGALETGMDLGSAVANTADYLVPGKAPVSTAYDGMLRRKFGDQLAPHASVTAQANAAAQPPAPAPALRSAATFSPGDATMPGQDPGRPSLRAPNPNEVNVARQANGVMSFSGGPNIGKDGGDIAYTGLRTGGGGDRISTMPGMGQGEIDRTLTNPDGSRWSAGDNAIMAANLRDGADPYAGTSRGAGKPQYINAFKAQTERRGQDITERGNIRTNDTSLRNSAATNRLAVQKAQQDKLQSDRTYDLAAGTQAQALGEKYRENAKKEFMVYDKEGKPDAQGSQQSFDAVRQLFPGMESADEGTRNKAMGDAKEMAGIFNQARGNDKVGWDAMKFWEAKRPGLSGMPDARGATTEQTGFFGGLTTLGSSNGDTLLKRQDGTSLNLGKLTARQRELLETAKKSGWGN